ncbi:WD40-repeat-containing domain [Pseudocohnilembus persalinus]|uniref:WD40-repeat-containing domain n=1 Tax=Pseudocohnilembus persalinus TaxID=266149 RepID=A0A0V0R2G2_PSEPJ|nr:WD40-repeat-containing domain [Pseudocohnilembus persalinus]|eukprot:KRX08692.1 WD40-repeat-containing domain [Pseudocohnilembus persalinus]
MEQQLDDSNKILHLNFSPDFTTYTCATEQEINFYTTDFNIQYYNNKLNGGVDRLEKMENSNIIALTGGGVQPKFKENKLIILNDYKTNSITELSFKTPIINFKLAFDKLIVIEKYKICIYQLEDLKLLMIINTSENAKGLFTINDNLINVSNRTYKNNSNNESDIINLNNGFNHMILAYPHDIQGSVNIYNYDTKQQMSIKAHQQQIQIIQLCSSGFKIATASKEAAFIRIFNTQNGELLHELRRGFETEKINSINFNRTGSLLCLASRNGQIQIFGIKNTVQEFEFQKYLEEQMLLSTKNQEDEEQNQKSEIQIDLPYFKNPTSLFKKGELNLAFCTINEKAYIAGFGPELYTLIAITYTGKYYKFQFDPNEQEQECGIVCEEYFFSKSNYK